MIELKPGPKPTKHVFGFIDEVGLLHSPKEDRVFGLGLVKLQYPAELHRKILSFKDRSSFHEEFKFKNVRDANLRLYKSFIDLFFNTNFTYFGCIMFDKSNLDIRKFFKNNYNKAYNPFTANLISNSLEVSEYIVVLADDISTPKKDNYEREIKAKVRTRLRRDALFGICRVESHAISELQMVDVLLGTVAYAFKIKYKLIKASRKNSKFKLMLHLQKNLNTAALAKTDTYQMKFGRVVRIKESNIGFIAKKLDSALGTTAN